MRFKNMERYRVGGTQNNMTLNVPLPKTPEGRIYRLSPNKNAHPRLFVLGNSVEGFSMPDPPTSRTKHRPRTPGTVCPYSGMYADDEQFNHPDDIIAATEIVAHAAFADVADHIHNLFGDLERKTRSNRFLTIKTGSRPRTKPAPRFAREDLLRALICDDCGRDYGVFAISLFCPDCGAPNIHLHFDREAALISKQVELATTLKDTDRELAYRMLGNAHEDVVTAFEATLKTVYLYKKAARTEEATDLSNVGNVFQNLERAQKHFAEFELELLAALSDDERSTLVLNIQKRHVIGHNLGVADAKFAEHAEDARLGETVPLVGEDILAFAHICHKVVDHLDTWLADGIPPPQRESANHVAVNAPAMSATKKQLTLKIGELDPLAIQIGTWISKGSVEGFPQSAIDPDTVKNAFPNESEDTIAIALAELEKDGFVDTERYLDMPLPHILPKEELFITFDPHALGTNPVEDAAIVVDLVLQLNDSVDAQQLHEASGWPIRRFNPAFAYVVSQIEERHVFRSLGSEYPARGFLLEASDKVDLTRFAKRLRRPR